VSKLTRRDFLKLMALVPPAVALSYLSPRGLSTLSGQAAAPNIIVIVFDAMTARNLSVYGYPRETTPHFNRFAQRASVYHAHYAAGNFTVPGTASLLTGMYPWTHRAINQSGLIARHLLDRNFFGLVGGQHHRDAYTQNIWVDMLLSQFGSDIDTHLSPGSFGAIEQLTGDKFGAGKAMGYRAFDDFLFRQESTPASLLFGTIEKLIFQRTLDHSQRDDYPRGIPGTIDFPLYFRLEDTFDGLISHVSNLTAPYFAYYHLWAPHEPYRPRKEFIGIFKDHWTPVEKPMHRLGENRTFERLLILRQRYDEYVANIDAEFGRLLDALEAGGVLDQSYVLVTSDHGQMFERGVEGHITPLLYDPVIHVPLMISSPGQNARRDIYLPTNSVDVLPTLLHLVGRNIPDWCEGKLLPGFGGVEDAERSVFSVEAKLNPAFAPINKGTIAMRKGKYKLIYYTGYEKADSFELYDLENDFEELTDLYSSKPSIVSAMREELLTKFHAADLKQAR
jgi:arylsulfatase A-like enzyme